MVVRRSAVYIIATLLLVGIFSGCGELRPPGKRTYVSHYVVKKGDTLYSIAWRYGYDHREVAAWNDIEPPYRIYPGQRLAIIAPYRQERAAPARSSSAHERRPASNSSVTTPKERRAAVEKLPAEPNDKEISWRWPTEGKVVQAFSLKQAKKGVDIEGKPDQPVLAAAGGDVVYSGDGLRGYGNLVIIKHNATYLSAYGHNRKLMVNEGERVEAGQQIATMGQAAGKEYILHFEIRRNGKPVDPMSYLPE